MKTKTMMVVLEIETELSTKEVKQAFEGSAIWEANEMLLKQTLVGVADKTKGTK